jgi:hypothetical protein
MNGATVLKWIGVCSFALGFVCTVLSLFFVASRTSLPSALVRGAFQRREDYTATGWRLIVWGRWLGIGGFLLTGLAMRVLGAD